MGGDCSRRSRLVAGGHLASYKIGQGVKEYVSVVWLGISSFLFRVESLGYLLLEFVVDFSFIDEVADLLKARVLAFGIGVGGHVI